MKKSLWKNNFKEIIKTRRRFLSILIMAFLGVGFFSGLVATSPDMQDSLDKYADSSNLFDIDVVSTLGLTDDDVNAINNIDGIESAYGVKSKDSIVEFDEKESICKVIEYNENSNVPVIVCGRLPELSNECLLDAKYSIINDMQSYIGKKIVVGNDGFAQKEFTVVGIVESPLYISNERGNTSIGKGSIDFYIYVKDDVINIDYYTNIYATVENARGVEVNSDNYWDLVNPVIEKIENIKQEREDARYNQLINESAIKFNESQKSLNDARESINKIEKVKWYVRNRKDNTGYTNMIDAIKTLNNIAKLFPVIFYLIAILISLTSMTRMVEEERIEIGTLKALGYTNIQIILKYVLYSLLACIIGGVLGMTVGFYLIPNIVWNIYSAIYTIPKFYSTYRLEIGLKGLIIAFACIGGATLLVASKELKSMPSSLMRPKAPKNGKKILLEKIPFIWKNFNFSKKVTARNIFRYKKRAIMTIVRNCWLYRTYAYRFWNQRLCYGYSRISIY